jgi:hypothetical protein
MTESKTHHYAAVNERRADSELCVEADASLPRHMTPAHTSSRWRRAWRWIGATRARRIALTLATLVAMASPYATEWYDPIEAESNHYRWVPVSAKKRAEIIELWGTPPADCEQLAKREIPETLIIVPSARGGFGGTKNNASWAVCEINGDSRKVTRN